MPGSAPATRCTRVNGRVPRDVIEWRLWSDEAVVGLEIARNGIDLEVDVHKRAGEPLGAEVSSALFDRVRTCDNHCEFCFIYQLPKGLRRSLYLKDDDYRLSFLYGNFTTLTRFTESDLERVVTEGLSPLHVSIHSTDPALRARMLRNPRGATSLRWLRALLDHGIEVRGQLVVCPGVNDGRALDDTLAGILDEYPELSSVAVVPLGISRFNPEAGDAPAHTGGGGGRRRRRRGLAGRLPRRPRPPAGPCRRRVLPDGRPAVPCGGRLRGLPDARGRDRHGPHVRARVPRSGRLTPPGSGGASSPRSMPAAARPPTPLPPNPAAYTGLRAAPTVAGRAAAASPRPGRDPDRRARRPGRRARWSTRSAATTCASSPSATSSSAATPGVTGLLTGADLTRVLAAEPAGHRYLLPDVCLSDDGRFLDGGTVDDLPRPVEVVATDGHALRRALEMS